MKAGVRATSRGFRYTSMGETSQSGTYCLQTQYHVLWVTRFRRKILVKGWRSISG